MTSLVVSSWPGAVMLVLLFSGFLCLYRIGKGPTAPDRTVAIDILGTLMVGFCAVLTWVTGRAFYMNIGITWALLSFIGTIALAKYLEGRDFDD
ncbi:cation:proton antiporter [bacterium]|nr:cation:proton antiporter [bacterium]